MMKSQSQPVAAVVVATETKKAVSAPKEKAAPKRRRGEESETVDGKKAVKKVKRTRTKRLVVDGDDAPKRSTGGLSKPMRLSAPLAALLGVPEENRCQVVARLWKYIKDNNLQNPDDKRSVILDAKMRAVFHQEQMTGFSMNKFLSPHLSKIE